MATTHTFCRICESLCGLEADVQDGEIRAVRPDKAHVASEGFACPKGLRQHELYRSPDRLQHPMGRGADGVHRPARWDEALADIGARVRAIRAAHGPQSIAMYVGTAAGFSVLHPIFAQGFMDGLGSRSMYATATQDCASKFAAAREIYGFPFIQPFPDIDRTGCLVMVGANPVISKWSFGQVPNPGARLRARVQAGMAMFVVDPRRTETVKVTGARWVPIRPDTDLFFYLALLHERIGRGDLDLAALDARLAGASTLPGLVADWSPARCAEVTGIPAATISEIVDAHIAASAGPGAALYLSTGVNMGTQGAFCFWLQEAFNAITGNLDRPGGMVLGEGLVDFARHSVRGGRLVRRDPSRIGGIPQVNDAFAGGVLADEILTPGPGQVRALFVTGGNPLLTMPNAGRLREAFRSLDLLVTVDLFLNETGSEAHWALPATSPFERPDIPFLFPLLLGLQRKPYLQATRPLVAPPGDARDEATIYHDLAKACGVGLFGSKAANLALDLARSTARALGGSGGVPQEAILDLLLRIGREGSFSRLLASPHGRARPPHAARGEALKGRVHTPHGRVELAPAPFVEALPARAAAAFAREAAAGPRPLKLITRRAVETHNSWTHNHPAFIQGNRGTNLLYMHPTDAADRGLRDGDLVDVQSATATVRLPLALLDDLRPGAVALPHGWGHQHARGLSVAAATRGVNVNLLAADGPAALDPLSGMAHLTGIPVEVRAAAGPADPRSWSGLPAAPASAPADAAPALSR